MSDEGRDEAYEERGAGLDGNANGVILAHRYAAEQQYMSERELDRRAHLDVMQEMADKGRPVHSIPWLGKARLKAKVKHRQWAKLSNGWAQCKKCGFPVPSTMDSTKILHQEEHAERERVLELLARDHDKHANAYADLRERMDVIEERQSYEQFRLDALLLALGHADPDALQSAVERVMSYARKVAGERQSDE